MSDRLKQCPKVGDLVKFPYRDNCICLVLDIWVRGFIPCASVLILENGCMVHPDLDELEFIQ